MDPDRLLLTRRGLLLAGAGGLLLAACGNDGDQSAGTTTTRAGGDDRPAEGDGPRLAIISTRNLPVGPEVRIPLAVAASDGSIADLADVPQSITVRVGPQDGELGDPITLDRHADGIPRHYFPLRTTLTGTGVWVIEAEIDGATAAEEVAGVPEQQVPDVPGPGEAMPAIPTPTFDQPLGVDPICTRDPVCPLHEISLQEALGGDRPIVLLVSTPAFCQQAVCGPVLDLLVEESEEHADAATFIHVEVYTDETTSDTTDAVKALGLAWEPSLFLAAPDGTVNDRLDFVYDRAELKRVLSRLLP